MDFSNPLEDIFNYSYPIKKITFKLGDRYKVDRLLFYSDYLRYTVFLKKTVNEQKSPFFMITPRGDRVAFCMIV